MGEGRTGINSIGSITLTKHSIVNLDCKNISVVDTSFVSIDPEAWNLVKFCILNCSFSLTDGFAYTIMCDPPREYQA